MTGAQRGWSGSTRRRLLLGAAGWLCLATAAGAQAAPKTLADSIEAARRQRIALEAAIERQLATGIAERAKNLSMSNEAGALQQIEALLDSAHARLLVQRDRIGMLRDAATKVSKAEVVVLLRADRAPAPANAIVVSVDGREQARVSLSGDRSRAIAGGASDELYRGALEPGDHGVTLTITGAGTRDLVVPVTPGEVRYVEFVMRGGVLTASTWASRGGSD